MNHHCFLCGMEFGVREQKYPVSDGQVDVESAVFLDQPCFEKVREIRRARGGSMWDAMLCLSGRLQKEFLGI